MPVFRVVLQVQTLPQMNFLLLKNLNYSVGQ